MQEQAVFRPETEAWRGPGAPPVAVPKELADLMDRTYRDNTVCELPCDPMSQDAVILIRLLRIHAKRQGKALSHQFFHNGGPHIRFRMRDKRTYTPTTDLPRELR